MYLGRVVEMVSTEELFVRPDHPHAHPPLAKPRLGQRKPPFAA